MWSPTHVAFHQRLSYHEDAPNNFRMVNLQEIECYVYL